MIDHDDPNAHASNNPAAAIGWPLLAAAAAPSTGTTDPAHPPPPPPRYFPERATSLWGWIPCSMQSFDRAAMFMHPTIVSHGWRSYLGAEMREIERYRPRGVILQCWRGQFQKPGETAPSAQQRFFMRHALANSTGASAEERFDELYDCVREIQSWGVLVLSYEGPPQEHVTSLTPKGLAQALLAEFETDAYPVPPFDGYILDGGATAPKNSAHAAVIVSIDENLRARIPAGIEHMAGRNAEHWDDRISLSLAGARGPDGIMRGKFDPEKDLTGDGRLHRDFAPMHRITGECIALDLAPLGEMRLWQRAQVLARLGCSPCIPCWALPRAPWRQGFYYAPFFNPGPLPDVPNAPWATPTPTPPAPPPPPPAAAARRADGPQPTL